MFIMWDQYAYKDTMYQHKHVVNTPGVGGGIDLAEALFFTQLHKS